MHTTYPAIPGLSFAYRRRWLTPRRSPCASTGGLTPRRSPFCTLSASPLLPLLVRTILANAPDWVTLTYAPSNEVAAR
jgi:hypothetical protein